MSKAILKKALALLLGLLVSFTCLPAIPLTATAAEPADYAAIRDRFYQMAVGGEYDPANERLRPMLDSINNTAQSYWDRMNPDPVSNADRGSYLNQTAPKYAADYIFPEYPLGDRGSSSTESNNIQFTFAQLRAMAVAYKTEGCALYGNAELLADIKSAVDFVFTYHFNTGIPKYDNWYTWELGAPMNLGELLLILYNEYTEQEIRAYAAVLPHYLGTRVMTGANEAWAERVRLYAGILLEESSWMKCVPTNLPALLTYTTAGDGYYTDGGFIQHDSVTYNGGYGAAALNDIIYLISILDGSPWAIPSDQTDILYDWIRDAYEPIVYKGLAMDTFRGREITRTDSSQGRVGLVIASAMLMLADASEENDVRYLKGVVKGWFENDHMINELNNCADSTLKFPLDTAVRIYDLLADGSIPSIYPENGRIRWHAPFIEPTISPLPSA